MKYADLHIHTKFSDGTFSLPQIISLAAKAKISCISITDHDSVEAYLSCPSFNDGLHFEQGRDLILPQGQEGIEIIPGIELTADWNNAEVHILGYCIDYQMPGFQEKIGKLAQARLERMRQMCRKLTEMGLPLSAEEVVQFSGHSCVGRLHLARLMLKKALVSNTREAFNKYIGDSGPAYVSKFRLTPAQAIELIRKAKGVAVLAHPYSLNNQDLIPEFVQSGLGGLEAVYPEHTPSQIEHYKKLARQYDLCVTGGSDCHGQAKPEVKIGMLKLPYTFVEKLKEKRGYEN